MTKPLGYIIQWKNGSAVQDVYGNVALFATMEDARGWLQEQNLGDRTTVIRKVAKYAKPRKKVPAQEIQTAMMWKCDFCTTLFLTKAEAEKHEEEKHPDLSSSNVT